MLVATKKIFLIFKAFPVFTLGNLFVSIALLTLSHPCSANNEDDSSFLNHLLRAAKQSPEYRAAEWELGASISEIDAAYGQNYPQINALGSIGVTRIFSKGGGNYPLGSAFLELRENIWNKSFNAQTRLKRAEFEERKANTASTQVTILRRYSMLYVDWINAQQLESIYNNQVKLLEKIIEMNKKRFARGDDTKLTLQQANMRLLNAESQVKLIHIRTTSLKQRLAMEAQDNGPEKAMPEEFENVFDSLLKTKSKENSYYGNETRRTRLDVQDANVELSRSAFGPRLDFVARAGATNYASNTSFQYSGKTLIPEVDLGLELTVPIYDGNTHTHALRAALQRRNAVEEHNKAELAVTHEQIVDFTASQQMGENSKSTHKEVLKIANERTVALETQMKYGMNTMFELLTASEELLQADRQRVTDLQTHLQANVELAVTTNRLTVDELEKLERSSVENHEFEP